MISLDCEMVTTKEGFELAHITLIDYNFNVLFSEYVKPINEILDYNTK